MPLSPLTDGFIFDIETFRDKIIELNFNIDLDLKLTSFHFTATGSSILELERNIEMEGDKDMFHTLPMGDSSRNVDFKVFKTPLENCWDSCFFA